MHELEVYSPAKINLGLNILSKRPDGYHNISTIMQEVDLRDRLVFRTREDDQLVLGSQEEIPLDRTNLVYKAWELLSPYREGPRGMEVFIDKQIPMAAGLAGGSTDAAASLRALNQLWDLGLEEETLLDLALEIGADVPFCLRGGTLYATGVGNEFTSLASFGDRPILIVNPGIAISTKEVYEGLRLEGENKENLIKNIVTAINNNDTIGVGENLYNKLEDVVLPKYKEIRDLKEFMDSRSLGALMSGSGSSVFGIFQDQETLLACRDEIKKLHPDYTIISTKSIG